MSREHRISLVNSTATQEWGRHLGARLRAGDLVILTGELGAGKTTLTRGIGDGLRVRGPVTSPTFVIARRHPSVDVGGADLVHIDAYRLSSRSEIDDLDLDLTDAVTVVEWGAGLVEDVSDSRLEITLTPSEVGRDVHLAGYGPRWDEAALRALTA